MRIVKLYKLEKANKDKWDNWKPAYFTSLAQSNIYASLAANELGYSNRVQIDAVQDDAGNYYSIGEELWNYICNNKSSKQPGVYNYRQANPYERDLIILEEYYSNSSLIVCLNSKKELHRIGNKIDIVKATNASNEIDHLIEEEFKRSLEHKYELENEIALGKKEMERLLAQIDGLPYDEDEDFKLAVEESKREYSEQQEKNKGATSQTGLFAKPSIVVAAVQNNSANDDVPSHLQCPLLLEIMNDPVICLLDDRTYERKAIVDELIKRRRSPFNRQAVLEENQSIESVLRPNRAIKDGIDEYNRNKAKLKS